MGFPQWVAPVLGGGEIVAAIPFLVPRLSRIGGYSLLVVFAAAAMLHVLHGQFEIGSLLVYGAAAFVAAFEGCTIRKEEFHHEDHVRMGFLYMSRFPGLEGLRRFSEGLERLAAASGKPTLYRETITWAFLLLLIRERLARALQRSGRLPS